jgi:hypothetical protein
MKLACNIRGSDTDSGGLAEVILSPIMESIEPKRTSTTIEDNSIMPKDLLFG